MARPMKTGRARVRANDMAAGVVLAGYKFMVIVAEARFGSNVPRTSEDPALRHPRASETADREGVRVALCNQTDSIVCTEKHSPQFGFN